MRFAILGAGALGTILGAHLSRAGHEVAMIVRGERASYSARAWCSTDYPTSRRGPW